MVDVYSWDDSSSSALRLTDMDGGVWGTGCPVMLAGTVGAGLYRTEIRREVQVERVETVMRIIEWIERPCRDL